MANTSSGKPATTNPGLSLAQFLIFLTLIGGLGLAVRVVDLAGAPPGLHFDQAANGLLGLDILGGRHPVFFSSYTGREALFMYLIAALVKLLGPSAVAIRLAGALAGAATVVALGLLGAELWGRRTGLLAAAFLAGLYWHIHISRLGERTILVPLLDVLALWALWKGFGGGDRRQETGDRGTGGRPALLKRGIWAAIGGGLIGLQLYTYPSSRFFVAVVGAAAAIGALTWPFQWRAKPRSLASAREPRAPFPLLSSVFCLLYSSLFATFAGVLVAVPLALHFVHVPGDFLGRADQVAIWTRATTPAAMLTLLENSALRTLAMFLFSGDLDWKYNLAGRPVFDPLSGAFFLLGLAAALWRIARPAERLCLIWLVGMLLPGFLSVDAPQFMRTLGAAPPAVLLAARGLSLAADWLGRRRLPLRALAPVLLAWPAVAGGIATYQYFAVWAPSAPAYYALEGDVTDAVGIIRSQAP
ncbi:MAG TPA: glycosyltransferase family 39 protein, partial [Chloroflexota bacterium]|nr:glycosyltransferase family 39 protein [Chloroflexota bacterium]